MKSAFLFLAVLCGSLSLASADDWPQWRGPNRDDVSKETGLLKSWPKGGPKLLWSIDSAGIGYSGPAILGNRLYTLGAREDDEFVYALDTATGKGIWATPIGPTFNYPPWGDGPRCTPTVDGDYVYALGGQGNLVCVESATGKIRWQKKMQTDLGGRMMSGWGYTESPLVDGDRLICSPGGNQGTLAALDKRSGEVIWRSTELKDAAAYASISVAVVDGVRLYVQLTGNAIVGVEAEKGGLLWRVPRPSFRTAVIPTPVISKNSVYVTAGYGAGCILLRLTSDGNGGMKAETVYENRNLSNHHGGVVLLDGRIFGYSDQRGWVCQDVQTGKNIWEDRGKLPKGSVTFADGRFYCYSEADGTVALVEPNSKKWVEHGRFAIPQQSSYRAPNGRVWTHPVVANGRLYLRDQELLYCFDIHE